MDLGFLSKYPYTDFHELNIDWLLNAYKQLVSDMVEIKNWIDNDAINFNQLQGRISILETKTALLQTQLDSYKLEVNRRFDQVDVKFDQQKALITAEYRALFNTLTIYIESQLSQIRQDMAAMSMNLVDAMNAGDAFVMNWVRAQLDAFINNLPDYENLIIYNPVQGIQTTVQTAINDLYNYFNAYALTASEYDSMGLTAQEYDDYELTANEYDSWGRKLLPYPDPDHYMRDPFTGEMAKFETVIMELYGLHRGGISAEDYDALELTATDYDSREIPAYIYDMVGI